MKDNIRSNNWLVLILVILVTFVAYVPALKNGWTKWDDTKYILENPFTEKVTPENIRKIFTHPVQGNYIPITFLSFAIERTCFGEKPGFFIFFNIFLHLLNTLLVFFLIRFLVKDSWTGIVCSLIFGLHPMHVESVAWIAERKDVLYSFWFLLSVIVYLKYTNSGKAKWFLLALLFMLLSIMSKSIAVILPLILMAVDYFLNRKISKKIIIEKIPFLFISLLFMYLAKNVIELGANDVMSHYNLSFFQRIVIASYALIKYIGLLLVPINLSAYYPYPFLARETMPAELWVYFFLVIIGVGLALWYGIKSRGRIFIFSALFFIFSLFPLLQIYPVGDAVMADRFVYIAMIGFFLPVIHTGKKMRNKRELRSGINAMVVVIAGCFLYLTHQRCGVWKDAKTLWTDVLNKNDNISLAHVNLGSALFEENKIDSAIFNYSKAMEIDPENKDAYYNRGVIYFMDAKYEKAIVDFREVVRINDFDTDALMAMGISYVEVNKFDSAIKCFDKYVEVDSLFAEIYVKRGVAKYRIKDYKSALLDYNKAIALQPQYIDAYNKRGVLKIESGDSTGACQDWHQAQRLGSQEVRAVISQFCKE